MAFIGNQPTAVPLTSSQLADGLITTAKLATDAVTTAKLASTSVTTAKVNTAAITTDKLDLISTASVPAITAKGTPSVSDGYIQLNCEQNSHGIKLKSPPHSAAQSYTLTFPSTAPTDGTFLQTNSSGVLSFASAGATAGQVIQVVTATDSTNRTTNSSSFITGSNTLSATITPSASANKVFAICSFNCGIYVNSDTREMIFTIFRGATDLGASSSAGMASIRANLNGAGAYDISQPVCISVLDSPNTTSAITYQLYYRRTDNNYDISLNNGRKGSITLFEIKG